MNQKNIKKAKKILFIKAFVFVLISILGLIIDILVNFLLFDFSFFAVITVTSFIGGFIFHQVLVFKYEELLSEYEGYLKSLNKAVNRYSLNQDIKENDLSNKLKELETMLKDGIINEEEYALMRQKIISKF